MSSCEFCEFSMNTFFIEHIWVTASLICGKNTRKFINSLLHSYQHFLSVKAKVFPEEILFYIPTNTFFPLKQTFFLKFSTVTGDTSKASLKENTTSLSAFNMSRMTFLLLPKTFCHKESRLSAISSLGNEPIPF